MPEDLEIRFPDDVGRLLLAAPGPAFAQWAAGASAPSASAVSSTRPASALDPSERWPRVLTYQGATISIFRTRPYILRWFGCSTWEIFALWPTKRILQE